MGPPGVGKGTQASRLAESLGVPAISTGELFRQNIEQGTPIGLEAKALIDAGKYVADSIVDELVAERLGQQDAAAGFILDGYPRTVAQAHSLDAALEAAGHAIEAVVLLDAERDQILERLIARAESEGRSDDTPDVIRVRLEQYTQQTKPIVQAYERRQLVHHVAGEGTPDDVAADITRALGARTS